MSNRIVYSACQSKRVIDFECKIKQKKTCKINEEKKP